MANLRQKFKNFWSFLTRPGDKHDENGLPSWSKLQSYLESQDFLTFLSTRLPISWFLVKYHSEWNFSLFNKNGNGGGGWVFRKTYFHFLTDLKYTGITNCRFIIQKLALSILWFLLVLVPEPVLYIWLIRNFAFYLSDTHSTDFASLRVIFQTEPRIFSIQHLNFRLRFSDHWSRKKEAFVGVRDGNWSTSSPGSFVHHALFKNGVCRQHATSTAGFGNLCGSCLQSQSELYQVSWWY